MAIAGSNKEAFFLRIDNGTLRNLGVHRPSGALIENDPVRAVEKLKRYGAVYLWKYSDNLVTLQRLWAQATQTPPVATITGQGERDGA
jgi:hypothetical protein